MSFSLKNTLFPIYYYCINTITNKFYNQKDKTKSLIFKVKP